MPSPGAPAGLRFTDRMHGWFALGDDDFAAAAARGERDGTSLEFVITITCDDLDAVLAAPAVPARITGTVTAPLLSAAPQPFEVVDGAFQLLVDDPARVETQLMKYRMDLRTPEGRDLRLEGFKVIH